MGCNVRVDLSSNINEVLGWTARLHPQFQFAAAKALTDTVRLVHKGLPAQAQSSLDQPTPFTTGGFYTQAARKDSLVAAVGVKDTQAKYLWWQVEGGLRPPARKALKLPSVVQLNAYGNIPAGLIRTLIARAKAGKRATKGQARRFGVSQALDLFYGEPGDGRPAGIYKRVVISSTRNQLVPIIVFPQQPAQYAARRFDFYGYSQRVAAREFGPALDRAWRLAMATAR